MVDARFYLLRPIKIFHQLLLFTFYFSRIEMEHNITAVLQPGGGASLGAHRRGPDQGVHEPHAVYGSSCFGQETRTHRLRQRL